MIEVHTTPTFEDESEWVQKFDWSSTEMAAGAGGHHFILVATNYFTKWVEAIHLKKVEQAEVVDFFKEQLMFRFGILETITTDQGIMFTGGEVKAFLEDYRVKLLTSIPHYAQANGQAEASNKVIIFILQKTIEDDPQAWHRILPETLWAYRISKRTNTTTNPFTLTYGHDASIQKL
ncbi:uncharacterized protein LOC119980723 [Tripterygium wilfordii]|uniref:uncharacterized protein LOC119980723 n=1 Tax=Tripterygium wilfordii TaxID=458696 RepID=UPI0018F7F87E|nr:uncharacterized protein LOC119980723 [Tripterygium wilfordii]